jgi:hypothetical protein
MSLADIRMRGIFAVALAIANDLTQSWQPCDWLGWVASTKKIRAAHAKEKQRIIRKTRNRPNRLNLLSLTLYRSVCSTFLRKIRV